MNLPGNFSEVSGRAWREAAGEPRWSAARRDGKRAEEQSCSPWLVWSLCPLNGGLSAAPTTSGLQFQTGDGSGRQRGRGHSSHGPDGARTGGLRCLSAESCARLLLHALHWGSHQCPFPYLSLHSAVHSPARWQLQGALEIAPGLCRVQAQIPCRQQPADRIQSFCLASCGAPVASAPAGVKQLSLGCLRTIWGVQAGDFNLLQMDDSGLTQHAPGSPVTQKRMPGTGCHHATVLSCIKTVCLTCQPDPPTISTVTACLEI